MNTHITIFERDIVVAQDIAETVIEEVRGADIYFAKTMKDVCSSIASARSQRFVAILHATEAELRCPLLTELARSGNMSTIAIHREIETDLFRNWIFLPPPFTSEALGAALRSAVTN